MQEPQILVSHQETVVRAGLMEPLQACLTDSLSCRSPS
jgi:hypothetical protein